MIDRFLNNRLVNNHNGMRIVCFMDYEYRSSNNGVYYRVNNYRIKILFIERKHTINPVLKSIFSMKVNDNRKN